MLALSIKSLTMKRTWKWTIYALILFFAIFTALGKFFDHQAYAYLILIILLVPSKKVWVNPHLNFFKSTINQGEVQLSREQIDNNLIVFKSLIASGFRLRSLNN